MDRSEFFAKIVSVAESVRLTTGAVSSTTTLLLSALEREGLVRSDIDDPHGHPIVAAATRVVLKGSAAPVSFNDIPVMEVAWEFFYEERQSMKRRARTHALMISGANIR